MTHWYAPSERLPKHNEQVLVRHGDHINLALFDAQTKSFILRNGETFKNSDKITWMEVLGQPAG